MLGEALMREVHWLYLFVAVKNREGACLFLHLAAPWKASVHIFHRHPHLRLHLLLRYQVPRSWNLLYRVFYIKILLVLVKSLGLPPHL